MAHMRHLVDQLKKLEERLRASLPYQKRMLPIRATNAVHWWRGHYGWHDKAHRARKIVWRRV
jgi:hypothetical protein